MAVLVLNKKPSAGASDVLRGMDSGRKCTSGAIEDIWEAHILFPCFFFFTTELLVNKWELLKKIYMRDLSSINFFSIVLKNCC